MYSTSPCHATSPFFTQTISLISTLRTEIFNKGAISLEDKISLVCAKPQVTGS
jgi:hypothetical protein